MHRTHHLVLTAALIVAAGLIACGFLAGGRYDFVIREAAVVRLDRWTGKVAYCQANGCIVMMKAGDVPGNTRHISELAR